MTDPRRQRFAPYIRRLADMLALKDWTFVLYDDAPEDPEGLASILTTYGRKRASIRIGDGLLDESPEVQRHCIVHELIHAHWDAAWQIATEAMPEDASPAFRRMAEHGIDAIADGIAPLLPLPSDDTCRPSRSTRGSRARGS